MSGLVVIAAVALTLIAALPVENVVKSITGLPCPRDHICMNAAECRAASGTSANPCSFGNVCCKPLSCPKDGNGFCVNKASCKTERYTAGLCPGDNSIRCCTAPVSDKGFRIIKDNLQFFKYLHVQGNVEFIGYSHQCSTAGECKKLPDPISEAAAVELLRQDVKPAESCVTRFVKVDLNDDQYSAIISFVFSNGCPTFYATDVLAAINAKAFARVPDMLCKYTKTSDGKRLASLVKRRSIEATLFAGKPVTCP
jgi:GH24 family phage-related lysozyme (muramidase)